MMGMVLPEDEQHLWIAEESLFAPIPEGKPVLVGYCRLLIGLLGLLENVGYDYSLIDCVIFLLYNGHLGWEKGI